MPHDDRSLEPTLIAEDLLLALFLPGSGTFAGEGTLFYALGGAVLADLAQQGLVEIGDAGLGGSVVRAAGDPPEDALLRPTWEHVATKPRGVQGVLAARGPTLRQPLIDRLVARGDLDRVERRVLGLMRTSRLLEGTSGRREELVAAMRAVLVDGEPPTDRVAALVALVSASGALPMLHREIPWSSTTATTAKALEQGDWAAGAAATAVTRTMVAVVTNALTVSAVVANR